MIYLFSSTNAEWLQDQKKRPVKDKKGVSLAVFPLQKNRLDLEVQKAINISLANSIDPRSIKHYSRLSVLTRGHQFPPVMQTPRGGLVDKTKQVDGTHPYKKLMQSCECQKKIHKGLA